MAYLPPSEKEKEDKLAAQGGEAAGAEKVVATESSSASQQPAAQTNQPAKPQAPTSSGSFTNLMGYVNANQGKDTQMGQQVRGVVDNTANKATTGLQGYQANATSAINQGTTKKDDTLINNLSANPTSVDKNQFTQHYNAAYKGPGAASEIQGFGETQQGFEQVGRQVQSAGSGMDGRTTLLNDAYGRPSYTQGEKRLDSFILGTGQGGQQQLQGIQDTYGNFGGNFTDAVTGVEGQIAQGKTDTDTARTDTRTAYDNAVGGLEKQFDAAKTEAAEWSKANKDTYNTTLTTIAKGTPTERVAAFKQLGIDPNVGNFLLSRGMTPQQIVAYTGDKSMANFLDEGQVNNYNSLLGLLDGTNEKYNFDANVVTGDTPFSVDTNKLRQGGQVLTLEQQTKAAIEQQAAQRAQAVAELQALMNGTMTRDPDYVALRDKLGLGNMYDLSRADEFGIDLNNYLTYGGDPTAGNVMTPQQMSQYKELLGMLGIKGGLDLSTSNTGSPWSFNRNQFITDWDNATRTNPLVLPSTTA